MPSPVLAQEQAPAQDTLAPAAEAVHTHEQTAESEQVAVAPVELAKSPTLWDFILVPKYLSMLALIVVGTILLLLRKVKLWIRITGLVVMFVFFGLDLIFPLHPSPMCATTKLFMFRFTHGQWFYGMLAFFLVIFVPGLIGRKLYCGWACPLGAFQDLVNKIPFRWRFKQFSFAAFNSVRFMLLLMFILTFFVAKSYMDDLGERLETAGTPIWRAYSAYSVYDPINFFELLHWGFDTIFFIMIAVLIIASLMLYRPFCYLICPIGALSWLLEKIAPGRIRIDRGTCNDCGVCVIKSPCPTIKPLLQGASLTLPDCTSCGECIDTCPKGSIKFGLIP